jgi:hypothetical protein
MADLKHRARHTTVTSLSDVCVNDEDDEADSHGRRHLLVKAKWTRFSKTASWKLGLGGLFVLATLGAVLRRRNRPAAPPSRSQASPLSFPQPPPPQTPLYGSLHYGLYRFEASRLGPEYLEAVRLFDDYIGGEVDSVGARFAASQTRLPGSRKFHEECYQAPDEKSLLDMEQQKKLHSAKGIPRLEFLRQEQDIFYGAAVNDTMITENRKWAWRTAAVFSAQYAGKQNEFRRQVHDTLQLPGQGDFFGGRVSGTFWYPPNAIREWHTNNWDLQVDGNGHAQMPWRMYYVRQKAATPTGGLDTSRTLREDPTYFRDKSALHLVEGPGIPPERLEAFGAYRLTKEEDKKTDDGLNVWRIPDQDGYVSLFRLQPVEPFRWHCIVADDSVHRYSMGISLDDEGVEAMLKYAGVDV